MVLTAASDTGIGDEASRAAHTPDLEAANAAKAAAAPVASPVFESPAKPPLKVRIVGGGCAGLAAAWELSRCPGYEVHVYEQSFRLGGKGASGRDDNGRIHEHGLHVWLGFYENAFRLMRECYAEVAARGWGPRADSAADRLAHGSADEAFFPEAHIGVGGIDAQDLLNVWSGVMPPAKGLPGEPLDLRSNPYTLANYLLRCLDLVKTLVQSTVAPPSQGWSASAAADAPADTEALVEMIARCMRGGALSGIAAMLNLVTLIEQWAQRADRSRKRTSQVLKVFRAMATQLRKTLSDIVGIDERLRWKTEMVDIVLAIAVGLIADRVMFRRQGLDAINDMDYRDWLARHGATRAALDSRFLVGIYELVFAYEDGDHRKPAFAAGVALRSALRMFFTYRGSMFWRLRSGMGDAVFAPLYRTLLEPAALPGLAPRSPVQFHFLHRLQHVELGIAGDGRIVVERLNFDIRGDPAKINSQTPVALDHFGCWPIDEHLLHGDHRTTGGTGQWLDTAGDALIFAMGVDDFIALLRGCAGDGPGLFRQLPERWQRMAQDSRTVATQAAQVWLDADFKSLGWNSPAGIVTALQLPFDTWADMTHTLSTERAWRKASGTNHPTQLDGARSVAYFCSVLPQHAVTADKRRRREPAAASLVQLLEHDARSLWPRAFEPAGLTAADRVVDPAGPFDKRMATDYVQVNAQGSERYTLSPPGGIDSRISPLDPTFANMSIAGDWTACGLDAGCVEAAVMSGKLAAHAITGGTPSLESIIGYDHP